MSNNEQFTQQPTAESPEALEPIKMPNALRTRSAKEYLTSTYEIKNNNEALIDDEYTVDDALELVWEHNQLKRDLHLDYEQILRKLNRTDIENLAAPRLEKINSLLSGKGEETVNLDDIPDKLLHRLAEPDWLNTTDDEIEKQPDYIAEMAYELKNIDQKLIQVSQNEELRLATKEAYDKKFELTRVAVDLKRNDRKRDEFAKKISEVYERAQKSNRELNAVDKKRIVQLEAQIENLTEPESLADLSKDDLPKLLEELQRLNRRDNKIELDRGLLLTEDMQDHIDKTLPSLIAGRPVLFVGDTGGAKTALAKNISREFMSKEPELVSFHGEINVYQLIGKEGLDNGNTAFRPGPVVRAMENGTPLILDEINAAPAEFLKRLNEILQLRPNDIFTVQEDSGERVKVKSGFCIIATANEKSARYKGVDVMSAELKNRFGANVRRVKYPDNEVTFGELPPDNMALSEAALADKRGEILIDLPPGQLEAFAKACHASQKIFTGNYDNSQGLKSYVSQDRLVDNKPGLDDTVLSPRMMVAILEQVRDGMGRVKLTDVLGDWVEGIEKPIDREVMKKLLDSYSSDDNITLLGRELSQE